MEKTGNKSLVSLLRNSVLLNISGDSLSIRFKNTGLFSEEKRKQVEEAAENFFERPMQVFYEEIGEGIDDSVRDKIEQDREKKELKQKKDAENSEIVQKTLSFFPGSKISKIEIITEEKDVKGS